MKRFISLMMIGLLSFTMTASVSCDRTETSNPVSSEKETPVPPENLSELEADAALYEKWIERIDPYVSQSKDGTYTIDWDSFYSEYPNLPTQDKNVVSQLMEGVLIGNQKIVEGCDCTSSEAQGYACWNYWWGRRCCYWGTTAYAIIPYYTFISTIYRFFPWLPTGIIAALVGWATYYTTVYGGFCTNATWIGGVWITHP